MSKARLTFRRKGALSNLSRATCPHRIWQRPARRAWASSVSPKNSEPSSIDINTNFTWTFERYSVTEPPRTPAPLHFPSHDSHFNSGSIIGRRNTCPRLHHPFWCPTSTHKGGPMSTRRLYFPKSIVRLVKSPFSLVDPFIGVL